MTMNNIRMKVNHWKDCKCCFTKKTKFYVVGALPKMLDKNEFDVRVIIPNYTCIPWEYRSKFEYVHHFYMDLGSRFHDVHVGIMKYP